MCELWGLEGMLVESGDFDPRKLKTRPFSTANLWYTENISPKVCPTDVFHRVESIDGSFVAISRHIREFSHILCFSLKMLGVHL